MKCNKKTTKENSDGSDDKMTKYKMYLYKQQQQQQTTITTTTTITIKNNNNDDIINENKQTGFMSHDFYWPVPGI